MLFHRPAVLRGWAVNSWTVAWIAFVIPAPREEA
jgi:hypothetical protein